MSRNNASDKQASRTQRMKCSREHCTHHTTARDSLPVSLNELQAPCDNLALTRKLDDIYPPINSCHRQKISQITKDTSTCLNTNEDGGQSADKIFAPNENIEPAITFKPSSPRIVHDSDWLTSATPVQKV